MSNSLWLHESQHARPPCPWPTAGVYPNLYPSSQWCHPATHPLSSPSPPTPNLPQHQGLSQCEELVFPSSSHQWPKYWSFSFSISSSKEIPGLISFRMDWLDLLAVQGSLKSLLQHHSSKASVLRCSALFMVQLSHSYMTTGKTIALTTWTFVGKVMSLLFNTQIFMFMEGLPCGRYFARYCIIVEVNQNWAISC